MRPVPHVRYRTDSGFELAVFLISARFLNNATIGCYQAGGSEARTQSAGQMRPFFSCGDIPGRHRMDGKNLEMVCETSCNSCISRELVGCEQLLSVH